jgi:hypothetical protein
MLHRFSDLCGERDIQLMLKPLGLLAEFGFELLDHWGTTVGW